MADGNSFDLGGQAPLPNDQSLWGSEPIAAPDEPLFPPAAEDGPTEAVVEEVVDYRVTFGGRVFEIGEPDIHAILALCNVIGDVSLRAEKYLAGQLGSAFTALVNGKVQSAQPFEATIFALLATINVQHFLRIAAIVLFGGKDHQKKEAELFFRQLSEDDVKVAPIVKALAWRIRQSEDLAAALGNFTLARQAVELWGKRNQQPAKTPPPAGATVVNSPSTS